MINAFDIAYPEPRKRRTTTPIVTRVARSLKGPAAVSRTGAPLSFRRHIAMPEAHGGHSRPWSTSAADAC